MPATVGGAGAGPAAGGRADGVERPGPGGGDGNDLLAACHGGAFEQEVHEGGDEGRVGSGGGRALVGQVEVGSGLGGLGVEVEDHLHVVGDEPDRRHDDATGPGDGRPVPAPDLPAGEGLEVVVDVRFQPARLGRAGARAVDEVVVGDHGQVEAPGDLRQEDGGEGLVLGHVADLRGQVRRHLGFHQVTARC